MTWTVTLLLKSLLVFALAGLALLFLRRASASARHLVCLLTLISVLALPLFSAALPGWRVVWATQEPTLAQPTPAQAPTLPKGEGAEIRVGIAANLSAAPALPNSLSSPLGRTPATEGRGSKEVGFLYLLGVLLAAARPLLGLWGISRLSRACATVDDALILAAAEGCAVALGLKRLPHLCRADVSVPLTWGWLRPVVVLPLAFADWPEDRLRSVLLHEMAHVKRRDWPCHRLADVACAVYWFHPLVWMTARRLRAESEAACDDRVLSTGIPAPDYARHLLEIASALPRVPDRSHAAIAMAQTSQIESRLHMILDKTRSRRTIARRVLVFALIPGTAALITLAILRPDAKAQAAPHTVAASSSAVTSSQPPLLFLWRSSSSILISFKPGSGTTRVAHPDLMLMTATKGTKTGTTLLAGVSDASKPNSQWWDAHGALLSKSAFEPDTSSAMQPLPNETIRQIAFRLPPTSQDVTLQYGLPQSNGFASDGAWPFKSQSEGRLTEAQLFAHSNGTRIVTAQFPSSLMKADLQVGIASGPWKVTATAATNSGMTTNLRQSGFVIGQALETKDGLSLTVSTDTADDIRIVAVDIQRHEILPNSIGGQSINKLDQITAQFNLPLSQIKEFRVETRPFQWVEYKDVALQPVK